MIEALGSDSTSGSTPSGNVLLHIGAGHGFRRGLVADHEFSQIILVEPNPRLRRSLKGIEANDERVKFIHAGVAQTDGEAPLNILNFSEMSSLKRPDDLRKLLPGIKVIDKPIVETISVATLCKTVPELEQVGGAHALIVEAPGSEFEIIEGLKDEGTLGSFQSVVIRCAVEAYYEDARPLDDVLALLTGSAFRLVEQDAESDPDWPILKFERDTVRMENELLKSKLAQIEQERDDATRVASGLEEQVRTQEQKFETELGLALRMQALARNDLESLQARYAEIQKEKEAQEELLLQLTTKLDSAAEYLRLMADSETTPAKKISSRTRKSKPKTKRDAEP